MTDCLECGCQLSSEEERIHNLEGYEDAICDQCSYTLIDEDRQIGDHLQDLAEQRLDEERRGEL